jgi:hypothetical protein
MHRHTMMMIAGALCVLGCGGDGESSATGGSGGEGGNSGAGGSGGGGAVCGGEPAPGVLDDVSGTWAMLEVAARLAQAPAIPDPIPNAAVTLYLMTQEQDGTALTVNGQACRHWVSDPESLVHTLIPDSYIVALEPFSLGGTYEIDAQGIGTYHLEPFVQVIGAELANPTTDNLPLEPTDPGVIDEDEDGSPGVTVFLSGVVSGSLYVVSRRVSTVEATATAADHLSGLLDFTAEENILASDPTSIKDLSPQIAPDPDECKSTVEMVRVPDGTDCATLIADYETLFPDGVAPPAQ